MRNTLFAGLLLALGLILASCGRNMDENTLVLFTWNDYLDPALIEQFTEETGINVHVEFFSTNEEMLAKYETSKGYYDLMTPSDHIADKLIQEGQLAKLDYSKLPNVDANLMSALRDPAYDEGRHYSLPYAWGTVGILYDTTKVSGTVDSWDVLWNPAYKGEIIMTDSLRDTIGVALKKLGYSMNTTNPAELAQAGALLKEQAPLVMGYMGDTTEMLMSTGEATLAVMWSGEAVNATRRNPNMTYIIPKEGANLWEDDFIIPKDSRKKELAEAFINFMYRPDVAYQSWEFIGYSTPNVATFEMLPDEEKNDKRWYPTLPNSNLEMNRALSDKDVELYNKIWLELKA